MILPEGQWTSDATKHDFDGLALVILLLLVGSE